MHRTPNALSTRVPDAQGGLLPMIDVVFLMTVFLVFSGLATLEAKLDEFLPMDKGGSPTRVEPEGQLSVSVHLVEGGQWGGGGAGDDRDVVDARRRRELRGHRVCWQVDGEAVASLEALAAELGRLARDPSMLVPDRRRLGQRRLVTCLVTGYPGACYDDVIRTHDAVRAAGFDRVDFCGGLGSVR